MKKLFTILLLFISVTAYAQWTNVGTATLQRQPTAKGYFYRDNMAAKGFVNWYNVPQLDSLLHLQTARTDSLTANLLPIGLQGQQLKVQTENTNSYVPAEPLVYGQFVYTDDQLARAMANGNATQQQIFDTWQRFAHGGRTGSPTSGALNDTIPSLPLMTNSFAYDTLTHQISSTFNSGSHIGFISQNKYRTYSLNATLAGSPSASDNDKINIVAAYVDDATDPQRNNAQGLDPGDFVWPINVTTATIPNQHTLTVVRNRNGAVLSYCVVYDLQKLSQTVIANGTLSGVYNTSAGWANVEVDVEVIRRNDSLFVQTTDFSDAPGGKGALRFPIIIDLNSNPLLLKFRGAANYGYSAQSQANAIYKNIAFVGGDNGIYDLRNGNTYFFVGSSYVLDPTKNLYTDFGGRYFWRNTAEHTFGYILPTATYDVIIGETP